MKKNVGLRVVALFLTVLVILAGCSSGAGNESAGNETPPVLNQNEEKDSNAGAGNGTENASEPDGIDWTARAEENKKAGKITFITGYNFAASSPNINAVIADELGYFEQLGLDVEVQPGLDAEGMKLLAAGRVQFAGAGSASLVIQSVANDAQIKGIALMSPVGLGALMVLEESDIFTPKDLEGKTVGYKGAMPVHFTAMFENGGADVSKINQVSVGYDPTILNSGNVDAITVFKSNEPNTMEKLGFPVRLLDPADYEAKTSFGAIVANLEFMEKYPAATEDFLRALLKAHEWIVANPDEAIKMLESRSETAYDVETETNRWRVESEIIASSLYEGHGVGWHTPEQWQQEIDMLIQSEVVPNTMTVEQVMDDQVISAIYEGDQLIWIE